MFYSIGHHLLTISSASEAHRDELYTSATKEMCFHAALLAKDRMFEFKEHSFNSACNKPNTLSVCRETWL